MRNAKNTNLSQTKKTNCMLQLCIIITWRKHATKFITCFLQNKVPMVLQVCVCLCSQLLILGGRGCFRFLTADTLPPQNQCIGCIPLPHPPVPGVSWLQLCSRFLTAATSPLWNQCSDYRPLPPPPWYQKLLVGLQLSSSSDSGLQSNLPSPGNPRILKLSNFE